MFSKIFFINCLLLMICDLYAQGLDSLPPEVETTVVYGSPGKDESGCCIEEVPGGYVICGRIKPLNSDSGDIYLMRIWGLDFSPRWAKTLGGIGDDRAYSLKITGDGGYIICGYTDSYGSGGEDVYLIKTDSLGDTLWTRTFGGTEDDRGCSVDITDDGGYIICGVTRSFGAAGSDIYLIKTDSSGDSLWAKKFGGAGGDGAGSVKQTKDKGYIIAGEKCYDSETNESYIYLLKTDSSGRSRWSRSLKKGYYSGGGNSVIETSDGGYVIGGWAMWLWEMSRVCLLKTDSQGDSLWWYIGSTGNLGSVIETKNHDYVVTGSNFDEPLLAAKVNSSGDLLWSNNIGSEYDYSAGSSIRQTSDGGYIAVGTCRNYIDYDGPYNIFVVKIAPDEAGVPERKTGRQNIILNCEPIVFSSTTEIVYNVRSNNTDVEIAVFDVSGERLKTIFRGTMSEGQYITSWDGTADNGNLLPNGVYFLRVVTANSSPRIRKLVLLR
jgi:hypothetical protein